MSERVISLTKGREVSLEKGIKSLRVSVDWKENPRASRSSDSDFDIDLIVVELDKNGKAISPDHLVFYGSILSTADGKITDPEEAVIHSGDDRDGSGEGEECIVKLDKVSSDVVRIVFLINIYDGLARRQTFDLITGAEVHAFEDNKDVPKLVYKIDEDYKDCTMLSFGELVRVEGRKWKFAAIGEGSSQHLFSDLVRYGLKFKESNI